MTFNTARDTFESHPWYGYYGDDFTGATDTLAQLAHAGLRTILFMKMPNAERLRAAGPLDAVGVAGTARAMTPDALETELGPIGLGFAAMGVRVLHYKVCSTFDSSPHIGSIGVAINTLRRSFPNPLVPIIGGQPDLGRYCAFGNLFAASDTVQIHRIDRHPTMRCHPVTPMCEADLREHLHAQGLKQIALIDCASYARPLVVRAADLAALLAGRPDAVLFDVLENAHLQSIGELLARHAQQSPLLAVGASSVAQALASTAQARGRNARPNPPAHRVPSSVEGPVFILAGSLSPLTASQIESARSFEKIELAPRQLCGAMAPAYLEATTRRIAQSLRAGRHVLAYTHRTDGHGAAGNIVAKTLALACGQLLCRVLETVALRRVAIAGGDTSSYAMQSLDAWGLSYLGSVCAGVALSRLHSDQTRLDGLEIVLKGGQMGELDLFERLLSPL